MLEAGIKGEQLLLVRDEDTAAAVGSGLLPVFATPSMLALMEKAASMSVAPYLEAGQTTVGASAAFDHLSATPVGLKVRCESTLVSIEGRKLEFEVRAYDECGLIGEGKHSRFIVDAERFLAKAQAKSAETGRKSKD